MDAAKFESLLWMEEGTAVDFKAEQYKFSKATDDEKAELLKDILGFANAWRQDESYILIGVKDVRGGRSEVVGIPEADQLADHSLQQFLFHRGVNQEINFAYEAFVFEGKQVGIICIERQKRPFWLKSNYGFLKRDEVYVRRGSSTDPTHPATPDEICRMVQADEGTDLAALTVNFASVETDAVLGDEISLDSQVWTMPEPKELPRLTSHIGAIRRPFENPNPRYFEEISQFFAVWQSHHRVRLAIQNVGRAVAYDARIELVTPLAGTSIKTQATMPEVPDATRSAVMSFPVRGVDLSYMRHRPNPGKISVRGDPHNWYIDSDFGDIQPGRIIYTDVFFLSRNETGPLVFEGRIFSNAPEKRFRLTAHFNVTPCSMTVQDVLDVAKELQTR